jgi:hypothetical protein
VLFVGLHVPLLSAGKRLGLDDGDDRGGGASRHDEKRFVCVYMYSVPPSLAENRRRRSNCANYKEESVQSLEKGMVKASRKSWELVLSWKP